jgi:hypothetical protein
MRQGSTWRRGLRRAGRRRKQVHRGKRWEGGEIGCVHKKDGLGSPGRVVRLIRGGRVRKPDLVELFDPKASFQRAGKGSMTVV